MLTGKDLDVTTFKLRTSGDFPFSCDIMIRKTWNNDKWLLTSQPEHARISAIIASAWNFNGSKPHEEVIKAIISHDDGWKEFEKNPPVTSDGDPCSFHEMRPAVSIEIFEQSIRMRRQAGHLYAAALIAGHFLFIVENYDVSKASVKDSMAVGRFISKKRRLLRKLRAEISRDSERKHLLENYDQDLRLLQVCDYLSLLLCSDFNSTDEIENVPYLAAGTKLTVTRKSNNMTLAVSPLPFKTNLRDHLTSWAVPFIPYESPEELAAAMEEVKTVTNEIHIGAA